ncbi:MAG: carbamoyltransferase HypF, partial [Anaerolineae bacterium]
FPVRLPYTTRPTLAVGPLLKNTFCLTRDDNAFLSQHIGDMENLEALEHYQEALRTYKHLFRVEPERVVADLHPDYLTTHFAEEYAQRHGLPEPLRVQHHHAHIAACLADNGWTPDQGPVIGVALDGTGYGTDGAIWGGEWLVASYEEFRRAAHLEYLPLPGGDAAIRQPWRIAAAYYYALFGEHHMPPHLLLPLTTKGGRAPALERKRRKDLLIQQIDRGINTIPTSSMGRLFDAVSALLGIRRETTYEAQAAIELEQVAATDHAPFYPYPFALAEEADTLQIQLTPLFEALFGDMARERAVPHIARRFHDTVAEMILQVSSHLRRQTGINTVALSGGVFQNRLLLGIAVPRLRAADFNVLLHSQVPPNDGGVSLGQAAIANAERRAV